MLNPFTLPPFTFFPLPLTLWIVLIATTLGGDVWAQQPVPSPDTLVAADYDAFTFVRPRSDAAARRGAATAQFEFDLTGFPAQAEAAFMFAASIWGTHLDSDVPIRVQATFAELETRTLGAAGPACVERTSPGIDLPRDDTWYAVALAESLLGRNLNPPGAEVCPNVDIAATFNSTLDVDEDGEIDWYYGTDGNPPAGRYDFATVVLHELGHGLGFIGTFEVATEDEETGCPEALGVIPPGFGCWGIGGTTNPLLPLIFDRFAEDGQGVSLLDEGTYPNPSPALGSALQSEAVRFDGPTAISSNGTLPIDLYAPANFELGSSFSHLDEEVSPPGDPNSLLTPQLGRAEAIFSPGPFACAIMSDIGWRLGADCLTLLQGGLVSFLARVGEDDVVFTFRLGADSGFTSALLEQQESNTLFTPAAPAVSLDPDRADAYEIRLGRLAPGSYTFRLRLRRADGSEVVRTKTLGVPPDRRLAVFPNPFTDEARVVIDLSERGDDDASLRVTVYDVLGRRVAELFEGTPDSAVLELTLDGRRLANGIYVVRVVGGSFEAMRTVTRLR